MSNKAAFEPTSTRPVQQSLFGAIALVATRAGEVIALPRKRARVRRRPAPAADSGATTAKHAMLQRTREVVAELHAAREGAWVAAMSGPDAPRVLAVARARLGLAAPLSASTDADRARALWPALLPEDKHLLALRAAVAEAIHLSSPDARPDISRALRRLTRALEAVVRDGENLCEYMVTDLTSRGRWMLPRADLLQEARMGLVAAAVCFRFDGGRECRNYLMAGVRNQVTRAEADLGRVVRVPVHAREKAMKVARVLATGANPEQVAAILGITHAAVLTAQEDVLSNASAVPTDRVDGSMRDPESRLGGCRVCVPSLIQTPEQDDDSGEDLADRHRRAALTLAAVRLHDPVGLAALATAIDKATPQRLTAIAGDPSVLRRPRLANTLRFAQQVAACC